MNRWFWIAAVACAFGVLAGARETETSPQTAASPATNDAFVLGQVVDVGTGRPIPEAIVTVTLSTVGPPVPAPVGVGVAATTGALPIGRAGGSTNAVRLITGADGRFLVRDLPKGIVTIVASAAGYVQGSAGQARPLGPTRPLDLDAGEHLADFTIRLWKQAVITGTVVDEHGEPAVGATVRVLRQAFVNGRPLYQPGTQASTDDRGVYRISAITPGSFLVIVPQSIVTMPTAMMDNMMQAFTASGAVTSGMLGVAAEGGAPPRTGLSGVRVGDHMVAAMTGPLPALVGDRMFVYETAYFPGDAATGQARAFTLGSGEEKTGVNFQLRALPAMRVSGIVTNANGPLPSVQVRLLPVSRLDLATTTGIEAGMTISAPDGTFAFLAVPAGQYVLSAVKPASPPLPAGMANNPMLAFAGGMSAAGQPVALYAQVPLTLDATDVGNLSLNLVEGARVSGRIEFSGSAPPPAEQALRRTSVTLVAQDGRAITGAGSLSGPPQLDQNNQFTTPGYPPGRYSVSVSPGPGGPWQLASVMAGGRDVLDEGLDLRTTDLTDVVITYADRSSSLSGTARMASGAAWKTATIVVFPSDHETWIDNGMTSRRSRTSVASKTGAFTLTGLPPGDYLVAALDDRDLGDTRDPAVVRAIAPMATRITLSAGERRSIDLRVVGASAR